MKISILTILLYLSVLLGQYHQDARMLGLSGAYTNISEGFSCVGINPANLSYGSKFSLNLGSIKHKTLWPSPALK